jgi:hypothetical protein
VVGKAGLEPEIIYATVDVEYVEQVRRQIPTMCQLNPRAVVPKL